MANDTKTVDTWELNASQMLHALEEIAAATREVADAQKKNTEETKEAEEGWLMHAKAQAAATAVIEGFKFALKEGIELLKDSVKAALDAEQADMKRSRALRNVGADVEAVSRKLDRHAEALERLTGVDDEYYKGLQTVLATMGVAPDQIEKFTEAALDLAAATGQDATMAARLLAKAHADGKDELSKYGISVDEATFKAKGFAAVIEEVDKKFGGLHKEVPEQVKQMNALRGAWESFKETLGTTSMQMVKTGGMFDILTKLIDDATDGLKDATTSSVDKATTADKLREAQMIRDALSGKIAMGEGVTFENAQARLAQLEKDLQPAWMKGLNDERSKPKTFTEPESEDAKKERLKKIKEAQKEEEEIRKGMHEADLARQKEMMKAELDAQDEYAKQSIETEKNRLEERKKALEEADKTKQALLEQEMLQEYEKNQKLLDAEKQFRQQMLDELKNFGMQVLNFGADMLMQQLTQSETYKKAYHDAMVQRRIADSEEQGAKKTALEVEKELQQEEKASQDKRTAEFLASIAKEAGIKAILESAEAIASLAKYDYAAAAQHGIAAAAFGGVAVASGVAAASISGARGMTRDEKESIEALNKRKEEKAERAAQVTEAQGPGQTVNQYFFGISGMRDVGQAAEVDRLARIHASLQTGA